MSHPLPTLPVTKEDEQVLEQVRSFESTHDLYWRARRALTAFLVAYENIDEHPELVARHAQLRSQLVDAARDYQRAGSIFFQIAT